MLMAAFAPSAKADLIAYFNFEDSLAAWAAGFYVRFAAGILG